MLVRNPVYVERDKLVKVLRSGKYKQTRFKYFGGYTWFRKRPRLCFAALCGQEFPGIGGHDISGEPLYPSSYQIAEYFQFRHKISFHELNDEDGWSFERFARAIENGDFDRKSQTE